LVPLISYNIFLNLMIEIHERKNCHVISGTLSRASLDTFDSFKDKKELHSIHRVIIT
ncbi:hypothetical protein ACJX0J_006697, partial [Zea mays]